MATSPYGIILQTMLMVLQYPTEWKVWVCRKGLEGVCIAKSPEDAVLYSAWYQDVYLDEVPPREDWALYEGPLDAEWLGMLQGMNSIAALWDPNVPMGWCFTYPCPFVI